jgi:hypothetical protein
MLEWRGSLRSESASRPERAEACANPTLDPSARDSSVSNSDASCTWILRFAVRELHFFQWN